MSRRSTSPTAGTIRVGGADLAQLSDRERALVRREKIGFIFQAFNLLPTLTAVENVALPLLLGRASRSETMKRAHAALGRIGLADRADHFPDELSGGEMQRVAVARALVSEPPVLLCDEPTGNLDSANSREILTLLASLPEAGKRAVVMVTHDASAARYGTRLVSLRDGLVEADEPVTPATATNTNGAAHPARSVAQ